jgi:hypothetical protein
MKAPVTNNNVSSEPASAVSNTGPQTGTAQVKRGMAEMLKGGVIMDVVTPEQAKLAQIRLYYSSNSPAYVRSHTALLSMIQALAYGVYSRDAEQYADRIKAFRLK